MKEAIKRELFFFHGEVISDLNQELVNTIELRAKEIVREYYQRFPWDSRAPSTVGCAALITSCYLNDAGLTSRGTLYRLAGRSSTAVRGAYESIKRALGAPIEVKLACERIGEFLNAILTMNYTEIISYHDGRYIKADPKLVEKIKSSAKELVGNYYRKNPDNNSPESAVGDAAVYVSARLNKCYLASHDGTDSLTTEGSSVKEAYKKLRKTLEI